MRSLPSARPRTPGYLGSSPGPGATIASPFRRRSRRSASGRCSTTSGWPSGICAQSAIPDTGLPCQFFELDRRTHLALWTAAPTRVLSQSRYAALLVSLHGTGLYERFPPNTDDPEIARAVADYLGGQRALQAQLAAELGAAQEELTRNQTLLAIWDGLSLALCRDQAQHVIDGFTLERRGHRAFSLDPWPFCTDHLAIRVEGRRPDRRAVSRRAGPARRAGPRTGPDCWPGLAPQGAAFARLIARSAGKATPMDEVLPGVLHWTTFHEGIGQPVTRTTTSRAPRSLTHASPTRASTMWKFCRRVR